MQNNPKNRFVSALLAVSMAVTQMSPVAVYAAGEPAPDAPVEGTTEKKDTTGGVTDTAVEVPEKVTTVDGTESVSSEPEGEQSEETVVPEVQTESITVPEAGQPEQNAPTVTTPAPEKEPTTVPTPPAVNQVVVRLYAELNGEEITERAYGRRNPEFKFEVQGLSKADEEAIADGSKTMATVIGFNPVVKCDARPDSVPGTDWPIVLANVPKEHYGDYDITVVPGNLHINKRAVTVTASSNQHKIYGDEERSVGFVAVWDDTGETIGNLNAPLSEGGTTPLAKVDVSSYRDPGENAGTYPVHIRWTTSANPYYDISTVDGLFTIDKAPLEIVLDTASFVYGEGCPRTIPVNEVKGFKNGENWETVFGETKPTFTATKEGTDRDGISNPRAPIGQYKVVGALTEPQNYYIKPFTSTMHITKRPMLLTVTPNQSKVYDGTDATPALNINFTDIGKVDGDFAGCKVQREPGKDVGFYKYDLSEFLNSEDAGNYKIAIDPDTKNGVNKFEIRPASMVITVPDAVKSYGDENPSNLELDIQGFAAEETIADLEGKLSITFDATKTTGIGEYDIVFKGLTSKNYNIVWKNARGEESAEQGIGRLTINPLDVLVKAVPDSVTRKYNKLDNSVTFDYALRTFADDADVAVVDPENSPLNVTVTCPEWGKVDASVGSYPIVVNVAENQNYNVRTQNGTATITSGDVTIIPDQTTIVYGDKNLTDLTNDLTFTAISAQDGEKQYKNGETITGIGTVSMTIMKDGQPAVENAKGVLDAGVYDIAFDLIPVDGKTFVFDDGAEHPDVDFVVGGKESGKQRMTVNVRPVTFETAAGLQKEYDDADPAFKLGDIATGAFTGGNTLANPTVDLAGVTLVRAEGEHVGKYDFTGFAGTEIPMWKNYDVTLENNQFEIVARKVVGRIQNATKVYGDRFDESTFSVVLEGFKNEAERDTIEQSMTYVCVGGAPAASVGSYKISATFSANPDYDLTIYNGNLEVTKRDLRLTFADVEKVYGEEDPTNTYSITGNINNEGANTLTLPGGKLNGTFGREAGENVGVYKIWTNLYNSNYEILYEGTLADEAIVADGEKHDVAALTIKAAPLTITVNGPYKIIYADKLPEFSVKFEGFVNGENAETALTGTLVFVDAATGEAFPERLNAGHYVVRAQGLDNAEAGNYDITYVDSTLDVAPRAITVKPVAATKVYGSADPAFAYDVISGKEFVLEGTDLTALHVVRAVGEDAGKYTMEIMGDDANFDITRETADFTITAKELVVGMKNDTTRIYGDENPVLGIDDLVFEGFVDSEELGIHDDKNALKSDVEFTFTDGEGKEATVKSHICDNGKVIASGLQNAGAENYSFTYREGKFIIAKRPITVSVKNDDYLEAPMTSVYGDVPEYEMDNFPVLNTVVYTGDDTKSGLVNGDDLVGQNVYNFPEGVAPEQAHVGIHRGAVVPQFSHPDYEITSVAGDYEITKRPLTLDLHDSAIIYGDKLQPDTIVNYLYRTDGSEQSATFVNGDKPLEAQIVLCARTEDYKDPSINGPEFMHINMTLAEDGKSLVVVGVEQEGIDVDRLKNGSYDLWTNFRASEDYEINWLQNGRRYPEGYEAPEIGPRLTIAERFIAISIDQPLDFTYGDVEKPTFEIEAKLVSEEATNKEPVVSINKDTLGMFFELEYVSADDEANPEAVPVVKTVRVPEFDTNGTHASVDLSEVIHDAGRYKFAAKFDNEEAKEDNEFFVNVDGKDYAVFVQYCIQEASRASCTVFVNQRLLNTFIEAIPADETVKEGEQQVIATKKYGEETPVLAEGKDYSIKYTNFAFDDAETVEAPERELIVADAVQGIKGVDGINKDAFKLDVTRSGNYIYDEGRANLNVVRDEVGIAPVPDVTVIGSIAKPDGTVEENVVVKDEFTKSWSVDNIVLKAPEGFEISCSDDLSEENLWSDSLIVDKAGKGVSTSYYLRHIETGAITKMDTKALNIDKELPVVGEVTVSKKDDIRNDKFSAYETAIDVRLAGKEIATRESENESGIMPIVAALFGGAAPRSAVAVSTAPADPNSGVAAVEYYTISKNDAKFDANGSLVIDTGKFKNIDLTYTDANNAHGTIRVSPDFVGYIVTRTKDNAGQYSAAAVATVSVVAPAAKPNPSTPPIRDNSKTGVGPVEIIVSVVALGAVAGALVFVSRKKKKVEDEEAKG